MQDLNGRTAVVTGAAGGIGLALARRFAIEGMQLVLCDIDEDELAVQASVLQACGADVLAVRAEATDPVAMAALAEAALERFGNIDVLCPNAEIGGPAGSATLEIPLQDWQRALAVDVGNPRLGSTLGVGRVATTLRSFLPHMLASGREGHVLFTASIRGLVTGNEATTYRVGKHAVLSMAETLRKHLQDTDAGIGVSTIIAGPVFTTTTPNDTASGMRGGRHVALYNRARRDIALAPLQAADIADQAVDAIRRDRHYVFPHEGSTGGLDWFGPFVEALGA